MIHQYLSHLSKLYSGGNATEHSYRADLQILLQQILGKDFFVLNESTRRDCGAPDYVIFKKEVAVGFIEAKDLKLGIDHKKNKEQFDRYKEALPNLIITDYLHFEFYKNGELKTKIALGEIVMNQIVPHENNFQDFINLIKDFATEISQTIKSPENLAELMAGKAKLISDIIHKTLDFHDEEEIISELVQQRTAFKEMLIHDIDNQLFADLYSQTIAYGLFVARYHDPTLPTFDRIEAANLIPKSNPFLRKLFQHIAGFDLEENLKIFVDDLIQIFLASDVKDIMKNFGKSTRQEDPVIHFYETFLGKYNPKLRKSRGVWYTPQPVVQFIVRAVDDLLKAEFGLSQGLADTSKIKKEVDFHGKKVEKEFHRVQVLDPATGTGTFLAETIKHIYEEHFKNINEGIWPQYVEKDLIPRINGFELLMASYSMAHLKLDMLLSETGYETNKDLRFNVFLTNSLEKHHPYLGELPFAGAIADESNLADVVKRDSPVMCVIGNPPYSGISSNNGEWISKLIDDYKYIDGIHFKERKHWLNDDYVKFIRFAQYLVEKNGEGIVAYINPHGYLDNPTFRGMRWNLLKTFDKIYTIDLHGNSNKGETSPDGSADQNVFDIKQGVSINLFVKTNKKAKDELGKVFHYDLFGKRNDKYNFLQAINLKQIEFKDISPVKDLFLFKTENEDLKIVYEEGFKISDLFIKFSSGIITGIDRLSIFKTERELIEKTKEIINSDNPFKIFDIKDTRRCKKEDRISDLKNGVENGVQKILFRPFDLNYFYHTSNNEFWMNSPRNEIMSNYKNRENIGLITGKSNKTNIVDHFIITKYMSEAKTGEASTQSYNFPLYLYQEPTAFDERERIPNFNPKILAEIEDKLGMKCKDVPQNSPLSEGWQNSQNFDGVFPKEFTPLNLLDYIYAVLHSPKYRETYKEFLKIDFPRVPFPDSVGTSRDLSTIQKNFWDLVQLGSEIRKLHLLEEIANKDLLTKYPIAGNNVVVKPTFVIASTEQSSANEVQKQSQKTDNQQPTTNNQNGKVYINETQYFENVPEIAWNFYIGGYQPAQKWLKDRKDRELSYEDILHYQKIIFALTKTSELMQKIDEVLEF